MYNLGGNTEIFVPCRLAWDFIIFVYLAKFDVFIVLHGKIIWGLKLIIKDINFQIKNQMPKLIIVKFIKTLGSMLDINIIKI